MIMPCSWPSRKRNGGGAWNDWPEALRTRDPAAMDEARSRLADAIQLPAVPPVPVLPPVERPARLCPRKGHPDHRRHPHLRRRWTRRMSGRIPSCSTSTRAGKPTVVAGVPPDYFSPTGQLWGNPLYDWDVHKADRLRLVAGAHPRHPQHSRHRPHRPLPRLCGLLGDPRRRPDRRARTLGAGPGRGLVQCHAKPAGRPADHRRRPGRDHPGRDRTARPVRPARDEDPAVRLLPGRTIPSCRTTTRTTAWPIPARTTTTPAAGWYEYRADAREGFCPPLPARATDSDIAWDLIRVDLVLDGGLRRRAPAGFPQPGH
ncbi:MAG: 4-alpha-glucanotransferase [Ignavibacteriales bacterium]|nr:4-alpha-glucanotransferase [Ignavibacteriales bacterium]